MKQLKLVFLLCTAFIQYAVSQVQTYVPWKTPLGNYQLINSDQGIQTTHTGLGSYSIGVSNSTATIASGESFTFKISLAGHRQAVGLSPTNSVTTLLADDNDDGTWVGSNAAINFGMIFSLEVSGETKAFENGNDVGTAHTLTNFEYFRINYVGSVITYQYSSDGVSFTTFHTSANTASGTYYLLYQACGAYTELTEAYKTGVGGGNAPPTVSAGANQVITLPVSTALLIATATDSDGTIASYNWTKLSGPSGGSIVTPTNDSTALSGLTAGSHIYRVTVTDDDGATATSDVTVTVNNTSSSAVNAGPDQYLALGTTSSTLSGTANISSSTDLIVFMGESNAAGTALNTQATALERLPRAGVQILNNYNFQFEDLNLDQNNNIDNCNPSTEHSFEIGLADAVDAARFNSPTYLVKAGCSGSRIGDWLPGAGAGRWENMIIKMDNALARLSAQGKTPNITVWMSIGLNDAIQGTSVDSFYARINRFNSYFRTRYGSGIRIHMTQFHRWAWWLGETAPSGNGHPYNSIIDDIATDDALLWTVETTGATYKDVAVHWDYAGFKLITDRLVTSTINNRPTGSATWTKISGPTGGTITSANNLVTSITALQAGTYVYVLAANGQTDTVNVFVGQSTSNITTSTIPITDPEIMRHLGGAEDWFDQNRVDIPSTANKQVPKSSYRRFNWFELETASGVYNWGLFDQMFIDAINRGQTVSWGVMTVNENTGAGRVQAAGAWLNYPTYLHDLMQAETVNSRDWTYTSGGTSFWIPNWNSPNFLTRTKALYDALYNRMNTQSHNGILFKNVVDVVEVRHYGQWGEWHAVNYASQPSDYPTGRQPTVPTLDSIISYIVLGNPDLKTTILISAFDGYRLANTWNDPAVARFALTIKNNAGFVGWRKDHMGDALGSPYDFNWTSTNSTGYTAPTAGNQQPGGSFVAFGIDTSSMNRWKLAPITGEPPGYRTEDSRGDMANLPAEVRFWHHASFGNGNFGPAGWNPFQPDSVRLASKIAGHRLQIESGTMTQTLVSGSSFNITLNWKNTGLTPTYDRWNVMFYLKNGSGVTVWSDTSSFQPYLFLPSATATPVADAFTLPSVPAGQYSLYVRLEDPKQGYRSPYPLAIQGRLTDGSYLIKSGITVTVSGSNIPPTVAINSVNQSNSITLPTNSITLVSSSTDPDGSIASTAWTKVTGGAATIVSPTAATTAVNGLVEGTYTFQVSVTDNGGAVSIASIGITVLPAVPNPVSPTANAGADSIITLPKNTVTLLGAGTDPDGTISSYLWNKLSGPAGGSLVTPTTATTRVENLLAGTYVYRLIVVDNSGASGSDDVVILVNPAVTNATPSANAGTDQSVQLPANSTTLTGTGTDADGTIVSYAWSKVSGPVGGAIQNPSGTSTLITGLAQGVYIYKLTVTDNVGSIAQDEVQIMVSPETSGPSVNDPVSFAGADSIIVLPRSQVTVIGSLDAGSAVSYKWEKVSGPKTARILAPASPTTKIDLLMEGTYKFRFSAIGASGAIAIDEVNVTVLPTAVGGRYYITNISKRYVGAQLQAIIRYEDNSLQVISSSGNGSPVSSVRQSTRTVDGAPRLVALVYFADGTSQVISFK